VYKHAFEVVRMDGKKRRYILAFPNEREMADWQTLIEQLISRQQSKVKRQSDARAAAHSEVHFPHTTHRKHPTNNVIRVHSGGSTASGTPETSGAAKGTEAGMRRHQ
jgi:hypothetical protein